MPKSWWRRLSGRHLGFAVVFVATLSLIAFLVFGLERRAAEFERALTAPDEHLACVLFIDGERVVAGGASGNVFVWDLDSAKRRQLKPLTKQPILCLAVSPDGFLSAGETGGTFVGWQLGSEKEFPTLDLQSPVNAIAIRSPAPQKFELAVGLANGGLAFVGMKGAHFDSGHESVKEIVFDPLARFFVSAGSQGRVRWWDISSHKLLNSVDAHEAEIGGLAVSSDGALVASGDWNGNIRLWDPDERRPVAALSQPDAVCGMAFAGKTLITASWDGRLRFFSTTRKRLVAEINTGGPIAGFAASSDGRRLATVSGGQAVDVWRNPLR